MCWAARDRRKFLLVRAHGRRSAHPIQTTGLLRSALQKGMCSSAHPAQATQASISSELRRPVVFKSAVTFFAVVAGVAKRLPLLRPASIERELEQTLCLVRCCRQQREKKAAAGRG